MNKTKPTFKCGDVVLVLFPNNDNFTKNKVRYTSLTHPTRLAIALQEQLLVLWYIIELKEFNNVSMTMNIDQEQIYRLIKEKEWFELLILINKYSKNIALEKDQLIINALGIFEIQFFGDLDNNLKNNNSTIILNAMYMLHEGKS